MSTTLYFKNDTANDRAADWGKIRAISEDAKVRLDDETVNKACAILKDVTLTNGQSITVYDSDITGGWVLPFGPCLLPADKQAKLRSLLADKSDQAAAMLDLIVELKLQIEFVGTDYAPAHMGVENWTADFVEVRLSNGRFDTMIDILGLGAEHDRSNGVGQVDLATFEAAVAENGTHTGSHLPLSNFVACAKRNEATSVYWA